MVTWLLDHLTQLSGWAYVIIFGLGFAETALFFGFVFPGETVTWLGGVLAGRGALNFWIVWLVAFVAATLGDLVGWAIGWHYGPSIRGSRLGRLVNPRLWTAGDVFFHKHGPRAVFLGRWVSLGKALMPPTAGMARVPFGVFLFWDVLGAFTWSLTFVSIGYAFAGAFETLSQVFGWANWVFVAIFLGLVVWFFMWSRRFERNLVEELIEESAELPETEAGN